MKIKALFVVVFFLMGFMFMAPNTKDVYAMNECEIVWIGSQYPAATNHRIRLTHVPKPGEVQEFVNQLFVLPAEIANQMLAVSLTAMSTQKNLFVRIADDGLTIERLWVSNE